VLRAIGGQARPDWADVAAERSFFDQPHLIREFRALTGETPVEFVKNQGRLSMSFTDPRRLAALLAG
jgi:AraC-like DNA-binding protein